jgi:hypothetical protein
LMKPILALQGFPFDYNDVRTGCESSSFTSVKIHEVPANTPNGAGLPSAQPIRLNCLFQGLQPNYGGEASINVGSGQTVLYPTRPNHLIVPFLAKRKAASFGQDVSINQQQNLSGTLDNLYSRIDLLAPSGHPDNAAFTAAVDEIIGVPISTKSSPGGKQAGFYVNRDKFITLDRMGDGVSEMIALIVELVTERNELR